MPAVVLEGVARAELLPAASYEAAYTPDAPVIGFAFEAQTGVHAFASDRRRPLAGDLGGQQSVAVSAEYGRHLHRLVYAEPCKPAKQQIVLLVRSAHLRPHDDRRR